ncbi:YceI family protein [Alicyclobacillus mengziensis]|uniref:Polyisoprenoid-binding protein n=1 Tax=Alicyclobacillus mengziensis TaxID=2931921 RepID=A0A9X7W0D7_9BACL|nr:YceI family protein [Alicyclobacillus mengziensis]QSO47862.1 polyisoprenoid-binding protein [Alicyclobacillus mengziensis]
MATVNWTLDKAHSDVGFSVRHMMISNVRGHFNDFEASVTSDDTDLTSAKISVSIDPKSIDTRSEDRDNHLRSADFFKVEEYPRITFESTRLVHKGGDNYVVEGNLSIIGTTKPVTLDCEIQGPAKDPWGNEKIGVVATGKLNRADFGLTWNAALEAGGVLVGDTVKLDIELQFSKG